uniref:Transposase-associated domain-containing protein n=1 Tax=Cajanus cajan TaxID=3821 RepID=A0A151S7B9_CAJCA|nr:hypothetical protein KK1_027594 [Cajanus cajan]
MPRNTPRYMERLHKFLDFAFANKCVEGKVICPCPKCKFNKWQTREVVLEHLIIKPFPKGYTFWLLHGETSCEQTTVETPLMLQQNEYKGPSNDPICDMVNDAFGHFVYNNDVEDDEDLIPKSSQMMPDDIVEYFELMKDGQQSLYDGCDKYSKLPLLIKLYHIKCLSKISDKAMSMILELLLADVFEHAKIPHTFYKAKKIINKLGLKYSKIDVCPYDYMLYFGEDKYRETCKKCNTSRWKPKSKKSMIGGASANKKKKDLVLTYFPLKRRLRRMFMHALQKTNDGILRHPRDSEAWKNFDLKHPQFSLDPQNVRLDLATDGFNPFAHMNVSHSSWRTVLIHYNPPPWMCMKDSSFMFSMIIPGKRAPGKILMCICSQKKRCKENENKENVILSRVRSSTMIDKKVHREFVEWFSHRLYSDDLKLLAMGPVDCVKCYNSYNVNEFKFCTLERDQGLKTQNNGIFGTFGTKSYASSSDNQMQFGGVPYYGKLLDIIEINYQGRFLVTLFQCMWANTTTSRGIVKDDLGFTLVSFAHLIRTGDDEDDEPYIQVSEAQIVYYVEDELDKNWSIPIRLKPRDLYDMGGENGDTFHECEPFDQ